MALACWKGELASPKAPAAVKECSKAEPNQNLKDKHASLWQCPMSQTNLDVDNHLISFKLSLLAFSIQ